MSVINPAVHRLSDFYEKLKSIMFKTKAVPNLMAFTFVGGLLNRSLFNIVCTKKTIIAVVTDLSGSGAKSANETFLVCKRILTTAPTYNKTIFGNFTFKNLSQTTDEYTKYIDTFKDFKSNGRNVKNRNDYTLAKLNNYYISMGASTTNDTLQMPGFVFYRDCYMKKMPTKNMHPIFGEIQTFSGGNIAKFWNIEHQRAFIDYIDVSQYTSLGNGAKIGILDVGETKSVIPPTYKGRMSDSLFLYCAESRDSLFTADNKFYPCVASETFLRHGEITQSHLRLSPYIKNDHIDFTLKNNMRLSNLYFSLTSPTGKVLSQSRSGPIRPFRNLFFTLYLSMNAPAVRLAQSEQIVYLTQRQKSATNNPFTVHIDEPTLIQRIKRHMMIKGNKVQGQLRQMLIPSKFTSLDLNGHTITADIIKIDCDLRAGTLINRNAVYANSLGYVNLQRDEIYKAIKDKDEQLTIVFDRETASGTSYKFDIKETSDIKSFTIDLRNQDGNRINFTNKLHQVNAQLAIIFS